MTSSPPPNNLKPQIINQLLSSYCPTTNIAEYFYIFGIDPNTTFTDNFNLITQFPKKLQIRPSLISQFPPFSRPYSTVDISILITHCFPQGFNIISSSNKPEPEIFHFNLDNLLHLEEVPKLYFTAFLFYESLSKYIQLRTQFKHNLKFDSSCTKCDFSYFEKRNRSNSLSKKEGNNHCKCLRRNKSFYKYKHDIDIDNIYEKKNNDLYTGKYVPKVICISSRSPFPREFHKILKIYYEYSSEANIKYPIEKLVEVLTLNIPLPVPGIVNYKYILPKNKSVSFSKTNITKRNIISYKMTTILNFQDKDIMEIFRFLLHENPILFFCKEKSLLTNIVNSFLELLFPFKYQYPNISILPIINYGLIEMESCFCFGINEEYTDDFFLKHHLYFVNKTIQIADIDNNVLKVKTPNYDQLPMIKIKDLGIRQIEELKTVSSLSNGDLHKSYKQKLSNRLSSIRKTLTQGNVVTNEKVLFKAGNIEQDEKKDAKEVEDIYKWNDEITDMFFEYIYTLLADYPKALHQSDCNGILDKLRSKTKPKIGELINLDVLDLHGDNKVLGELIRTKLFYEFTERCYFLNTIEDKITILYFFDTIYYKKRKNKSKKEIKFFCENSSFTSNQSITFRLPRYFTEDELYYIKLQSTKNSPLIYYQYVSNKRLQYYLFPKLLYDNTFFPNKILTPCKTLNIDLDFKSKLITFFTDQKEYFLRYKHPYAERFQLNPQIKFSSQNFCDYSYLCTLYMYSMLFYYCEFNEKHFRFYEIFDIINNISCIDKHTLSLLFLSIIEHGTDSMAIKLYEKIQEQGFITNYSEYAYLCNKLSCNKSNMKKNQLQYSKITLTYFFSDQNENKFYETSQQNINAIPRRTFNNKGFNDIVVFEQDVVCSKCKNTNEVIRYSLQYEKMDCFSHMAPCMHCNKQITPIMYVRYGDDKVKETFEMNNPFYLYMFYIKDLVRDYRTRLDLDVLRKDYTKLFWNCLWYMFLTFSNFDMLLKYNEGEIKKRMNRLESFMSSTSEGSGKGMEEVRFVPTIEKIEIQSKVISFFYLSKKDI